MAVDQEKRIWGSPPGGDGLPRCDVVLKESVRRRGQGWRTSQEKRRDENPRHVTCRFTRSLTWTHNLIFPSRQPGLPDVVSDLQIYTQICFICIYLSHLSLVLHEHASARKKKGKNECSTVMQTASSAYLAGRQKSRWWTYSFQTNCISQNIMNSTFNNQLMPTVSKKLLDYLLSCLLSSFFGM